jgi:hypothetical protein
MNENGKKKGEECGIAFVYFFGGCKTVESVTTYIDCKDIIITLI